MTTTAFQIGAFQFTGFQEAGATGSGGWPLRLLIDWARRERQRRKAKRAAQEEAERERDEALAAFAARQAPLRVPSYVNLGTLPLERSVASVLLRARLRPVAALADERELREFVELCQMVAEMEEA